MLFVVATGTQNNKGATSQERYSTYNTTVILCPIMHPIGFCYVSDHIGYTSREC